MENAHAMISQKPATDDALYRRAKKAVARGDNSMQPYIDWYEGKRTPDSKRYPVRHTLKRRISNQEPGTGCLALTEKYGAHPNFWNSIRKGRFGQVNEETARKALAAVEGADYEPAPQDWEGYRRVRDFLNLLEQIKPWCRKHNISPSKAYRISKDGYKNVPDVVADILEIIGD